MLKLAWRNLTYDPFRFLSSVGGVGLSIILIIIIGGIFAGSEEHAVLYIRKQPVDLWVMQDGVSNMHMSSSILPENTLQKIQQVDGVHQAVGVLYTNGGMEIGDTVVFNYVFGVNPDEPFGGPWELTEGTDHLAFNEIIIDRVLAQRYGLGLGDTVRIAGFELTIAGLSRDTFGIATSIVWVNKTAMADFLNLAPTTNSYILVQAEQDQDINTLRGYIQDVAPDVNLLNEDEFVDSDQMMIRQMGADLIGLMNLIAYIIGFIVIGITSYTATLEKTREYGVLKAIGAKNSQLLAVVVWQAIWASLAGYLVGVGMAYLVGLAINNIFPEMLVLIQPQHWLTILPVLLLVTLGAALLPISRIMTLDPFIVFKS